MMLTPGHRIRDLRNANTTQITRCLAILKSAQMVLIHTMLTPRSRTIKLTFRKLTSIFRTLTCVFRIVTHRHIIFCIFLCAIRNTNTIIITRHLAILICTQMMIIHTILMLRLRMLKIRFSIVTPRFKILISRYSNFCITFMHNRKC